MFPHGFVFVAVIHVGLEETRNGSLTLAGKFCVAVVEVRREGREEAEEWRELVEEAVSVKCFFF